MKDARTFDPDVEIMEEVADCAKRETLLRTLKFEMKEYNMLNKAIVSTKNRLAASGIDVNPKTCEVLKGGYDAISEERFRGLEKLKEATSRKIVKILKAFPVYEDWISKIKGFGPFIAGTLIVSYYAKFQPVCPHCDSDMPVPDGSGKWVCPECGKSPKKEGMVQYRFVERDFPNCSKWVAFCGMSIDPATGKKVKRQKNKQSNWNSQCRTACWHFGDQVVMNKDLFYYSLYLDRKKKAEKDHPTSSKGHWNNMAKHEMAAMMLRHFWAVARTLDGKPVTRPYIFTEHGNPDGKHTQFVEPPYFNKEIVYVDGPVVRVFEKKVVGE